MDGDGARRRPLSPPKPLADADAPRRPRPAVLAAPPAPAPDAARSSFKLAAAAAALPRGDNGAASAAVGGERGRQGRCGERMRSSVEEKHLQCCWLSSFHSQHPAQPLQLGSIDRNTAARTAPAHGLTACAAQHAQRHQQAQPHAQLSTPLLTWRDVAVEDHVAHVRCVGR